MTTNIEWTQEVIDTAIIERKKLAKDRAKRAKQERNASVNHIQGVHSTFDPKTRGYIYVIRAVLGEFTYYKIGRTSGVKIRLQQIKTQFKPFPVSVDILHSVMVNDMYQTEADLHKYFRDYRVNGEWFNLTLAQLDTLQLRIR